MSGGPTDADRHSLEGIECAPQSEVDFVSASLDPRVSGDGSAGACVNSGACWSDTIGKDDARVHAVHRHRPTVAGDVPVQFVERRLVAFRKEEPDSVGDVVTDDDRLIRVVCAGNPDAKRPRPTVVLSFLFDAKPPAGRVSDVADRDVELRPASLCSVVVERQVADDSVPLTVESDRQLLGDVERPIGVNGEERIEVLDADGAALRARITREREDPD